MGTLRIKGFIDLTQFWPTGKSDADTTKIKMNVNEESFLFSRAGGKNFKPTGAFMEGFVNNEGTLSPVVKYRKSKTPHVTTRLQGIDAPELHYKLYGRIKGNGLSAAQYEKLKKVNAEAEYRQHFSESATVALGAWLKGLSGGDVLACEFESQNINEPGDVIDCYGRFVGDIYVSAGGRRTSINRWLAQQGWVFPAFYNSMAMAEIKPLVKACADAKKKLKGRTVHNYSPATGPFDYGLRFRDPKTKPAISPKKDAGKLILPKMYRRLCVYSIFRKAGATRDTFAQYLASKDDSDRLILVAGLKKFLAGEKKCTTGKQRDAYRKKASFPLSRIVKAGKVSIGPEKMVFLERSSMLVDEEKKEIAKF
jgi:endonuclease YncB( thermonuclease family)